MHIRVPRPVGNLLSTYGNPAVHLGRGVRLDATSSLQTNDGGRIDIGDGAVVFRNALLQTFGGWIRLGNRSGVGPNCLIYGHGGLDIGNDTIIAGNVVVIPANHRYADPTVPISRQGETRKGITVGHGVWIAAQATVLDGVTIGDGAIVGAGAVVNRDVEPMSIVAGVPARPIGARRAGTP